MSYASIFLNESGAFRETGALRFFFIPKGALTHHLPAGQAVVALPLVRPCALRGGLRSLRRAPANAAGTAVPVIIVCAEEPVRRFPRLRKPATGSFVAEAGTGRVARTCILFCEREPEKRIEVKTLGNLPFGGESHQPRHRPFRLRGLGLYELLRHL